MRERTPFSEHHSENKCWFHDPTAKMLHIRHVVAENLPVGDGDDSTDSESPPVLDPQIERQRLKKAQAEAQLRIVNVRVLKKSISF